MTMPVSPHRAILADKMTAMFGVGWDTAAGAVTATHPGT